MNKIFATLLIFLATIYCFADVPVGEALIIKSDDFKELLQHKATRGFNLEGALYQKAICRLSITQGEQNSLSLRTPYCEVFFYNRNAGPALSGTPTVYRFIYKDSVHPAESIDWTGSFISINEAIAAPSVEHFKPSEWPNSRISINSNWQSTSHTILIVRTNAKH